MAQVNIDLSEYDMLRASKEKAEAEVKDLKGDIKKLKDNANNVVVRNRYYLASVDYIDAANHIIHTLGINGMERLLCAIQAYQNRIQFNMFDTPQIDQQLIKQFAYVLEKSLKDVLNLRASYIEDTITTEIRGFDELAESVKAKIELEYKDVMEQKKANLDRQLELYDVKQLDVEKEVKRAESRLTAEHEKEIKKFKDKVEKAEEIIQNLKKQLKEASKTSEEKLAEAMAKLQAAQEEVAKYTKPKKWFNIF